MRIFGEITGHFFGVLNDRFGSLAAIKDDISLMSAFGGKAVIRQPDFGGPGPDVRFHLKRSLELLNLSNFNVCFRPKAVVVILMSERRP